MCGMAGCMKTQKTEPLTILKPEKFRCVLWAKNEHGPKAIQIMVKTMFEKSASPLEPIQSWSIEYRDLGPHSHCGGNDRQQITAEQNNCKYVQPKPKNLIAVCSGQHRPLKRNSMEFSVQRFETFPVSPTHWDQNFQC